MNLWRGPIRGESVDWFMKLPTDVMLLWTIFCLAAGLYYPRSSLIGSDLSVMAVDCPLVRHHFLGGQHYRRIQRQESCPSRASDFSMVSVYRYRAHTSGGGI